MPHHSPAVLEAIGHQAAHLNPQLRPHRFYYLDNFQQTLRWIDARYSDLLRPHEHAFLADFQALPRASQALLVRMLMRRGPWFLPSQLRYEEIPDIKAAAAALLAKAWLDADAPLSLEELSALHTKPELCRLFTPLRLKPSIRKKELLDTIRLNHPNPQPYKMWNPDSAEPVWRVTIGPLCERLRLMFFGNLYQDWSEFVLADLGIFRYEQVAFDASSRAFQSAADVDLYLALWACRQALDEGVDTETLLQTLSACRSDNAWLEQRRAKMLLRVGQACERRQDWQQALHAYEQCHYPGARHRRMLVHERLAQFEQALALALQTLETPESEEESQRVARTLPRLRRRLEQAAPVRPRPAPVPRLDLELPAPQSPYPVELLVRDALHGDATPAHYVENALINSLFGLLCWPAIFAPLPGAFFHPFQRGPADLDAPDFTARRQTQFAACLAALDKGTYREIILQRFADKRDVQSPFVFWGMLTPALLTQALDCIPAAHLKLFFERLQANPKANRAGLPDLIRFWPERQSYELIEVKGPGDRLQDNQVRWIQYCLAHGIAVRVCHVRWSGEARQASDLQTGQAA